MQTQSPSSRTANQPYTIPLQIPYCLPYTEVAAHVNPQELKRKNFTGVNVREVAFKEGVLLLEAAGDTVYKMQLAVKPYSITVQCDCGRKAEKLCYHAANCIEWLTLSKGSYYFERFAADGELGLAATYPDWFRKHHKKPLHAELKDKAACLYISSGIKAEQLHGLLKPWYPAVMQYKAEVPADIVTGYCICCSIRNLHPPILLPFWAKLNHAGTVIRQFIGFFHKQQDLPVLRFTEQQYVLNAIAAEMLQLAMLIPANAAAADKHQPVMASVFHLWQKALPLLAKEKFLYGIAWFHYKRLPSKPPRQHMLPASFSMQPVLPQVQVKKIKEVIDVSINLAAGGKKIAATTNYCFLEMAYSKGSCCFYLFGSLRDAWLWQLVKNRQKIFLFPPVQEKALTGFLQPLCMYYPAVTDKNICAVTTVLKPEQRMVSIDLRGEWYVLTAFILYSNGSKVNVFTKGSHWLAYKNDGMVLMVRDRHAEHALKQLLLACVPALHFQQQDDVIVWHRNEINEKEWKILKDKLKKERIELVMGMS